jgi:hypothetical protein
MRVFFPVSNLGLLINLDPPVHKRGSQLVEINSFSSSSVLAKLDVLLLSCLPQMSFLPQILTPSLVTEKIHLLRSEKPAIHSADFRIVLPANRSPPPPCLKSRELMSILRMLLTTARTKHSLTLLELPTKPGENKSFCKEEVEICIAAALPLLLKADGVTGFQAECHRISHKVFPTPQLREHYRIALYRWLLDQAGCGSQACCKSGLTVPPSQGRSFNSQQNRAILVEGLGSVI